MSRRARRLDGWVLHSDAEDVLWHAGLWLHSLLNRLPLQPCRLPAWQMLARWRGGALAEFEDVNARLLSELTALLQTFPVAAPAAATPAPARDGLLGHGAARRRWLGDETSLLEDLRRFLDCMARPNVGGDFLNTTAICAGS